MAERLRNTKGKMGPVGAEGAHKRRLRQSDTAKKFRDRGLGGGAEKHESLARRRPPLSQQKLLPVMVFQGRRKVEAGGLGGVQGHPLLHSKSKASLGYMTPGQRKRK